MSLACSAALLAGCASSPPAHPVAQAEATRASDLSVGVELQGYPAGVIGGLQLQKARSDRDAWILRLAWNETDRQDFGEHDDETGGGFGGGVGYRRWFGPERSGWLWGARVDLWSLEVDWEDDAPAAAGSSDVLVLQPALEAGYSWRLGASRWRCDVTAALGAEINVDTDGEDVGEGAIGLLGASFVYGF